MLKKLTFLLITLLICTAALKSVASAASHTHSQPTTAKTEVPFLKQKDIRHRTLENFIKLSMRRHFTMKGNEASCILDYGNDNRTFYQFRGFTMQPRVLAITEADHMNGVDLKFNLILNATVHRDKKSGELYGDWKNGMPLPLSDFPLLYQFYFERRNGVFSFEASGNGEHCRSLMKL